MSTTLKAPRPKRKKPSAVAVEETARSIGGRLRALRKERGLTLVELGKAAEVDPAVISRIETGIMTGTLESHLKLATALGVKLTDLYAGIEEERTKDAVALQPAGARSEIYLHQAGKSSTAILTSDVLKRKLMPVLITIEPGGHTNREEARVGTEKFVYVMEGEVEAIVGPQSHRLEPGSSLYFDASLPHQLRNAGARPAKCLAVLTPPAL